MCTRIFSCVWDFAGQEGAVRRVLRGRSGRGVHPQEVSVISSLKPYVPIPSQKKHERNVHEELI